MNIKIVEEIAQFVKINSRIKEEVKNLNFIRFYFLRNLTCLCKIIKSKWRY